MKKEHTINRGAILRHFINKSWHLTTGLETMSEIECKQLVTQLVNFRQLNETEGETLLNDLLYKTKTSSGHLEKKINQGIDNNLQYLDYSTNLEIEHLQKRIQELEESIEQLIQDKLSTP